MSPDIVSILVEGEYRYFEVAGNLENQFPYGSHFEVTDSTGNNGMYTVNWASYNYQNCGDQLTRIQVNETIPSDVGDGRIVKGSVSSTITIDGTDFDVTFSPDEIPTFGDLLSKLNELFEGTGHIFIATTDTLTVESASFGSQSTVQITEPEDGTGLFQNLGGFLGNSTPGSDEWRNVGGNEYIPPDNFEDEDDWGRMVFSSFNPGIYRIRLTFGEIFTGEVDEFGFPITIDIPPPPQVAIQALGDPNRDGEPKDHTMYFTVNRSMSGENLTVNFSYLEEMDPPHLMYDEIQVLAGSQGTRLNVLANDGNPPGNNEDLTIVGLGLWEGADFLNDDLPTELSGNSQGYQNRSWTDGKYVYYDSPGYFYELFYYIVEDSEGNRDWTEIYIDPVFEITNQFAANEDFATVPITASRARINVLANDSVAGGGSKENLVITEVSTPTAGGTVSFEGTDVFYQPPPNFTGTDTFEYTMTDNYSGTATTKVTVIVTNSPVPEGQRGLLNLLLKLFGASRGGAAVFEFWNKHISEFDYLVLDQSEGSVAAKANGKLPFSSRHNGGTAETQANWNAILDMAESGIAATLAGQGDSVVVTQEFVDRLMAGIADVQERASPDFKADLQTICEMTNDFQDLVGKTFGEGFAILGLPPEDISIPNLALERINDVLSITTWDVAGLAF
ncbi:MAG: cadherin-like domain-containing protein, partial [Verrucomicrobiae bacterium]|nr:cadherin-like domain-containing protein [Verrucomicrobiae bacterium]